MAYVNNILETIGHTPLIKIGDVYAKCEFMNPSGSIKARIAKYMIEKAEREGLLKPGDTIVEATSGNTGNAMSMVAAVKGYKMKVVMPSGFSTERAAISRAFGAEIIEVGHFQVDKALEYAKELGQKQGYFCPQQFDNEWNVEENMYWLAQEIINQLPSDARIDAIVQGVGTGGTLIGVGKALKERHNAQLKVFAMEPSESPTIMTGHVDEHLIEGISDGFVPSIYERHKEVIDGIVLVDGEKAVKHMKELASENGLFVGPSSGANLLAARQLMAHDSEIKTVLTFMCDSGMKYLNQYYDKTSDDYREKIDPAICF